MSLHAILSRPLLRSVSIALLRCCVPSGLYRGVRANTMPRSSAVSRPCGLPCGDIVVSTAGRSGPKINSGRLQPDSVGRSRFAR